MKKIIFLMLVFMSAFIVSCGGSDSSSPTPDPSPKTPDVMLSDEDAKFCDDVTQAINSAVSAYTNPAGFPNMSPANDIRNKAISDIIVRRDSPAGSTGSGSWTDLLDLTGTLSATGSFEYDNDKPSFHYVITLTFTNYESTYTSDGAAFILNGTVTVEGTKNEVSDVRTVTTSYKENITVKAGSVERKINSDYVTTVIKNYITSVKQSTKKGTYELDGKPFKADESNEEAM